MTDEQMIDEIIKYKKIVFFGGAGVSTESNIPDFRSPQGLYNNPTFSQYQPEYLLSHECLVDEPEVFSNYYKTQLIYPNAKPNAAHLGLAELEQRGLLLGVITQNIDQLHQQAGSKNVIELHGNLTDHYCMKCLKRYQLSDVIDPPGAVYCECGGLIRPDVTLYSEALPAGAIRKAIELLMQADCVIVAGTSLRVYPAAGLINYARDAAIFIINKEPTPYDHYAVGVSRSAIGKFMKKLIKRIKSVYY